MFLKNTNRTIKMSTEHFQLQMDKSTQSVNELFTCARHLYQIFTYECISLHDNAVCKFHKPQNRHLQSSLKFVYNSNNYILLYESQNKNIKITLLLKGRLLTTPKFCNINRIQKIGFQVFVIFYPLLLPLILSSDNKKVSSFRSD